MYFHLVIYLISLSFASSQGASKVSLLAHCGQRLVAGDNIGPRGVLYLDGNTAALDGSCDITLDAVESHELHIRYVGISLSSCSGTKISVTEDADNKLSKYQIFSSYPHFCAKCIWANKDEGKVTWSGTAPYLFTVDNVEELKSSDRFVFEYTTAEDGDEIIWPQQTDKQNSPCDNEPVIPATTTTTGPQLSCPLNVTALVPDPGTKAKVTWRMPTPGGYVEISNSHPTGNHQSTFPLPGTDTNCVFVIIVKVGIPTTTPATTTTTTPAPTTTSYLATAGITRRRFPLEMTSGDPCNWFGLSLCQFTHHFYDSFDFVIGRR